MKFNITLDALDQKYIKQNKITTKIIAVSLKNTRQLKNKYPKFIVTCLIPETGEKFEAELVTRRILSNEFQVKLGYGWLGCAVIKQQLD